MQCECGNIIPEEEVGTYMQDGKPVCEDCDLKAWDDEISDHPIGRPPKIKSGVIPDE